VAMTPMLLKDIFEEQMGREMDAGFLARMAVLNGRLFSAGLMPSPENGDEQEAQP